MNPRLRWKFNISFLPTCIEIGGGMGKKDKLDAAKKETSFKKNLMM